MTYQVAYHILKGIYGSNPDQHKELFYLALAKGIEAIEYQLELEKGDQK